MRTFTPDASGNDWAHFALPAAPRLARVRCLVEQGAYFTLRAPARTGKTTSLQALASELTNEGRFAALVCPAAVCAPASDDFVRAEQALVATIRICAEQSLPVELRPPPMATSTDGTQLWQMLEAWARQCPRPLVLFFDEIDTLHGPALQSIIRQLEAGFSGRPGRFPFSIALVGQFDLRNRAISASDDPLRSAALGPFHHEAPIDTSLHFNLSEIRALLSLAARHSGHSFDSKAIDFVYRATGGHPWLVQQLGQRSVQLAAQSLAVTQHHALDAARQLVDRHITPIDALAARLVDPRVRQVIEPLIAGTAEVASASEDDVQFVRDLGLLDPDDPARVLGWIHQAIIPRLLVQGARRAMTEEPAQFFEPDGRLSMDRLLHGFAVFHAAHAQELLAAVPYDRVAPELVFFGFVLCALEGRGWVDFDYGCTRGRIEMTIHVFVSNEAGEAMPQREAVVLVSRRKGEKGAKTRGLAWLENAIQAHSSESGTLVVFDRRRARQSAKRIKLQESSTAFGTPVRLLRT